MKIKTLSVLTLMAGSLVALAQTNSSSSTYQLGSDAKSASSNAAGQEYPKIDSERHAEFRLRAPNAAKVQVDIGGHKYDMTKDDQGNWSVVTPPLVVGFHYYALVVDGVSMGGMQTRMIGLGRLDAFSHIGIFSGGTLGELTASNSPPANPAEFNRLVKVAFVSYGSVEGGANNLKNYHDSLVAAGITNMSYYISPGTAHEWQSWRRSFYQFAPMLFKN